MSSNSWRTSGLAQLKSGCSGANRCRYHSPGVPSGALVLVQAGPPKMDCQSFGGRSPPGPRPGRNQNLARSAEAGGPYQILVIPLLVEKNLSAHVDRVLVVDCEEQLQIQRLRARDGGTIAQAQAILNAQAPRSARLKAADDVIHNDTDMNAMREQVAALHARYLDLAQQPRP